MPSSTVKERTTTVKEVRGRESSLEVEVGGGGNHPGGHAGHHKFVGGIAPPLERGLEMPLGSRQPSRCSARPHR